ncbi:MAG: thiol:disulfide interchange protein DsbD, partial [Rhodocyclaceae bacterium]
MTMRLLFLVFAFFLSLAHAEEFLDPAVAFKPSVKALDGQTLEISYEIAKGYYLYRDKFRFTVDGETAPLGTPTLPKGKEHDDENFGKVEVYYKTVAIRVPVERMSSGPLALKLNVTSQGCADAGVCYPPQTQQLSVELPDPASAPPASAAPADGDESGRIADTLKNAGFWTSLAFFFIAGLGLL